MEVNKNKTVLFAATAIAVLGPMTFLYGISNVQQADAKVTSFMKMQGLNLGEAKKIIVEVESPYGHEVITSFKVVQTDNLMKESGYYTVRLEGPVMEDKRTLLHWIARDVGKLPKGLVADGVNVGSAKPAKMTGANDAAGTIPMSGKVTVQLLIDGTFTLQRLPVH